MLFYFDVKMLLSFIIRCVFEKEKELDDFDKGKLVFVDIVVVVGFVSIFVVVNMC